VNARLKTCYHHMMWKLLLLCLVGCGSLVAPVPDSVRSEWKECVDACVSQHPDGVVDTRVECGSSNVCRLGEECFAGTCVTSCQLACMDYVNAQ